jgi:hypothetical protein
VLAAQLGVSEFPVQLVINRRGKLADSMVGSASKTLRAEMHRLAADVRILLGK